MVNLSKFISNKKILSGVVILGYNQVYCQTLSIYKCLKGRVSFLKTINEFIIEKSYIHNIFIMFLQQIISGKLLWDSNKIK